MQWKKYPENKPSDMATCVIACKHYSIRLVCFYDSDVDMFLLDMGPMIPVQVHYFCEIADLPKEDTP